MTKHLTFAQFCLAVLRKKTLVLCVVLCALVVIAGSIRVFAWNEDPHYKDLYELKQLHANFHNAVSHAGINAATKAQHLNQILALWTDDGTLTLESTGVTYSGKGVPGTTSCEPGALTLCDLYNNVAGSFVVGHDWVSLTPIFTETISLVDDNHADIYYQCIYFDVDNNDALKSNVTFGLPGQPNTGRARKVKGQWLLSYAEVQSITPPTLDVPY
jgi:hypothetical protein